MHRLPGYGKWTCPEEHASSDGSLTGPYQFYSKREPQQCPIVGCGNIRFSFTPLNGVHEMKRAGLFSALWRAGKRWWHFRYSWQIAAHPCREPRV